MKWLKAMTSTLFNQKWDDLRCGLFRTHHFNSYFTFIRNSMYLKMGPSKHTCSLRGPVYININLAKISHDHAITAHLQECRLTHLSGWLTPRSSMISLIVKLLEFEAMINSGRATESSSFTSFFFRAKDSGTHFTNLNQQHSI